MSLTAPFPYKIDEEIRQRNPTGVFKLVFGNKYFIFKGLRIAKTVEGLSVQIHREISNPKEDSILFKVVAYIIKHRVTLMKVEVLKETDEIVDLLLVEAEALAAAKSDQNCLNTRFFNNEYFPNWIPQSAIIEFQKRLQGAKLTDTDKNFRRFLRRLIEGDEAIEKILNYVKDHYRAGNRFIGKTAPKSAAK